MTPANTAAPAPTFPEVVAPIDKLDLSDVNNRVNQLREMMLIGLAAYGEIERLGDKVDLYRHCNRAIPADLRVIHPTGSATTVGDFADALRSLDSLHLEVIRIATDACRKMAPKPEPLRAVDHDKPSSLNLFGHEVCQRVSAIGATIQAANALLQAEDDVAFINKKFRVGEVLQQAAKMAKSLSGDAIDAEVTMEQRRSEA